MHTPLSPKAFALATGSVCALCFVLFALISMIAHPYGSTVVSLVSTVYLGFRATIPGAIIGAIWGFADGCILGYVFAWVYNKCL